MVALLKKVKELAQGHKLERFALVRSLGRLECRPRNQKVVGLIPGQGTHLVVGLIPSWGVYRRQLSNVSLIDVSLSLSL